MPTSSGVDHVALTVTDLSTSVAFYESVLDARVAGTLSDGSFSQCVLALPSPTHLGLTQHDVGSGRPFDPTSPGLDRLRLACASRGADQGAKHLDNLGISHNDVQDATYGSALSLAAPAGNALEFRLCVRPIPSRSVRVAARPEPECSGRVAGRHVG